jgi:hypothetical protein
MHPRNPQWQKTCHAGSYRGSTWYTNALPYYSCLRQTVTGALLPVPQRTTCHTTGQPVGWQEHELRLHLADILGGQHVWPGRREPDITLHAHEAVAIEGLAIGKRLYRGSRLPMFYG